MKADEMDPFGAEFKRYAETMDSKQFKALSVGIGVGRVYQSQAVETLNPVTPVEDDGINPFESEQPYPDYFTDIPQSHGGENLGFGAAPSDRGWQEPTGEPHRRSTQRRRLDGGINGQMLWLRKALKLVSAHSLDMLAVSMSMLTALMAAGFIFVPHSEQGYVAALSQWMPVRLFLSMSMLQLVGVVYALFFVYWGLFRFIVGATVGQSFVSFFTNRLA